jgi:hypothetical protein
MAAAIAASADVDDRDVMVRLALHFHCAERLGLPPATLFGEAAGRIANAETAGLLRRFGSRGDVTLGAFGWKLVDTPTGPDFEVA